MSESKKKKREIPRFSTPLIETHCHLDYLKSLTRDEVISKSKEYGIEKFITISVSPDNLDKVIEISNQYEDVFFTQGIHPHEAKLCTQSTYEKIKSQAKQSKCLAIGEIGLDYHYNNSPVEEQRAAFEKQLSIASQLDLPVVIHSRDAEEDTISILKNHLATLKQRGVIHSFTSSIELAQFAIENGFYLGFNGIITFKNAQNVRDALEITPIDKLLLETDSPFLTPVPFRGEENGPYYLPLVAQTMADLKGMGTEELLAQVYKNSISLFKF